MVKEHMIIGQIRYFLSSSAYSTEELDQTVRIYKNAAVKIMTYY